MVKKIDKRARIAFLIWLKDELVKDDRICTRMLHGSSFVTYYTSTRDGLTAIPFYFNLNYLYYTLVLNKKDSLRHPFGRSYLLTSVV